MKTCKKCNVKKSLTQFHRCKKAKDGKYSYCNECKKKLDKVYFKKSYQKESFRERHKESYKRWLLTPNGEKHSKEYHKKYRVRIKERYGLGVRTIARIGFETAIEVYDRAERKCETCGEINNLVIHHKDNKGRHYTGRGLKMNNSIDNLIVLCRSCHGKIHGGQGGRPRKE